VLGTVSAQCLVIWDCSVTYGLPRSYCKPALKRVILRMGIVYETKVTLRHTKFRTTVLPLATYRSACV